MRPDLDLPRVVCEYEDVFSDDLSGFLTSVSSYTLVLLPSL